MNFSPVTKWSVHSRKSSKLSEPHMAQRLRFSILNVSRGTKGANIVKVMGAGYGVQGIMYKVLGTMYYVIPNT